MTKHDVLLFRIAAVVTILGAAYLLYLELTRKKGCGCEGKRVGGFDTNAKRSACG